jgi:two-component system sensor histidine kinase KdpD
MERKRGKLYIFTSYAPGAGKSYLMVQKAVEQADGRTVVIGFLNSEHRDMNQTMKDHGVKRLFRRRYSLKKLLKLEPDVVVMDELGMPGMNKDRKSFVYEDVDVLLEHGIDVYASANLKRFASLNPKFKEITGIGIRTTIPDRFLEEAEKIYFVDRETALMRLDFRKGKLFERERMQSGIMQKNFKLENLKVYRELCLDILKKGYGDRLEIYKRN